MAVGFFETSNVNNRAAQLNITLWKLRIPKRLNSSFTALRSRLNQLAGGPHCHVAQFDFACDRIHPFTTSTPTMACIYFTPSRSSGDNPEVHELTLFSVPRAAHPAAVTCKTISDIRSCGMLRIVYRFFETSVNNYQSTPRNLPGERICHLEYDGSLKSRTRHHLPVSIPAVTTRRISVLTFGRGPPD